MPAFLTADDTAFTAVCSALTRAVKSPVAEGNFRCSSSKNRVSVIGHVSIGEFLESDDMLLLLSYVCSVTIFSCLLPTSPQFQIRVVTLTLILPIYSLVVGNVTNFFIGHTFIVDP